jgi:hypothetical protein
MTSEPPRIYAFEDAVRFVAAWTAVDPERVESVLGAKARYLELAGIAEVEAGDQLLAERECYAHCLPRTPLQLDDGEMAYLEEVTGLRRDLLDRIAQADEAYMDSLGMIEWENDDERNRALGAPALPGEGTPMFQGHGDHWQCVVPSVEAFAEAHLEQKLGADTLLRCVPSPRPQWEAVVVHGVREGPGLATVRIEGLRGSPERPEVELIALFPAAWEAPAQPLRLERLRPWRGGCEASVEAATAFGAALAFFDIDHLNPLREWTPGDVCSVQLAGLAYGLEPAPDETIRIRNQETLRALRAVAAGGDPAQVTDLSPLVAHTGEMACLFPREDWNPDEFSFQGPVTAVDVLSAWQETLYRLEVTVMVDPTGAGDRPFRLPVLVSARNLPDGYHPRPGDRVRGTLWLQGRIVPSAANRPGPGPAGAMGAGLGGPAIIQEDW